MKLSGEIEWVHCWQWPCAQRCLCPKVQSHQLVRKLHGLPSPLITILAENYDSNRHLTLENTLLVTKGEVGGQTGERGDGD